MQYTSKKSTEETNFFCEEGNFLIMTTWADYPSLKGEREKCVCYQHTSKSYDSQEIAKLQKQKTSLRNLTHQDKEERTSVVCILARLPPFHLQFSFLPWRLCIVPALTRSCKCYTTANDLGEEIELQRSKGAHGRCYLS